MTAIVKSIIAEHLDELSFLWPLRETAANRPNYALHDLAVLDLRLVAHLDAVDVAGAYGREACQSHQDEVGPCVLFVVAVLIIRSGSEQDVQAVIDKSAGEPNSIPGLVSAIAWLSHDKARPVLHRLARDRASLLRRSAIAGCTAHHHDPGALLTEALSDADPLLRAEALHAAAALGRVDIRTAVRAGLVDGDERCRFAAASSVVLLGDRTAVADLRQFDRLPSYADAAVRLGVRASDYQAARQWQRDLAAAPATFRLSVIAAGHLGDPALVPWLIEQMAVPEHARVAGEAFTFITGVDLAYESMDAKPPEAFASGPNDDPADENVAMDPDEDLPWPNTEAIGAWWARHRGEFRAGTRYLLGKPITPEWMVDVLRIGRQRHRASAALELSLANPGRPLFNVCAPGFRQQQILRTRVL